MAMLNAESNGRPDALGVVDVDPTSSTYSRIAGRADSARPGDELHHFAGTLAALVSCPCCCIRIWSGVTWLSRN